MKPSVLITLLIAAVVLGACAPRLQTLGPAAQTGFIEPRLEQDAFVTRDGLRLGLDRWEADEPRAILIALHGMNDYANAFALPGPWWAERGLTTYAYDQRGHGRSPQRGIWPGSDLLIQDLADFVAAARRRHPDTPIYVLGHSMGGAVAIAAVAEGRVSIDGTILVAPAVWGWATLQFPLDVMLWITAHTVPGLTVTGEGLGRWPTDNMEVLRAMSRDELMLRDTRIDVIYGVVSLMDRAYGQVEHMPAPVLLLYGVHDQIIPPRPVEEVIAAMCPARRVAIYPNGYHLLLRDMAAETVWRDVLTFVNTPGTEPTLSAENRALEHHSCP